VSSEIVLPVGVINVFINVRFVFPEGMIELHNIEDYPDDRWNLLIAVNLSAPFHLIKRCLPGMKKKGTYIVCIF
jgi:NAD(P)-dependent dehydrogenase (short-subunit alcohol dehydrogenase family)